MIYYIHIGNGYDLKKGDVVMSVLQGRIGYLTGQAASLHGYQFLTSAEITALKVDQARIDRPALAGMPPLSLQQIGIFCREYEYESGDPIRRGNKQIGGFCGAVRRHQKRQLRLAAQKVTRHARALRKLDRFYVQRPGVSL